MTDEKEVRIVISEASVAEFMERSGVYVWATNDPYEMVWRIQSRGRVGKTNTLVLVPWDSTINSKSVIQ